MGKQEKNLITFSLITEKRWIEFYQKELVQQTLIYLTQRPIERRNQANHLDHNGIA